MPPEQLASDLWRIKIPLPFRMREVNLYLLRGTHGYTLIDAGIDTTDARALAEFYRKLLGLEYRQGDEPPAGGGSDDGSAVA